jgi:hypothetical protein
LYVMFVFRMICGSAPADLFGYATCTTSIACRGKRRLRALLPQVALEMPISVLSVAAVARSAAKKLAATSHFLLLARTSQPATSPQPDRCQVSHVGDLLLYCSLSGTGNKINSDARCDISSLHNSSCILLHPTRLGFTLGYAGMILLARKAISSGSRPHEDSRKSPSPFVVSVSCLHFCVSSLQAPRTKIVDRSWHVSAFVCQIHQFSRFTVHLHCSAAAAVLNLL